LKEGDDAVTTENFALFLQNVWTILLQGNRDAE